jgi:hypothetical protein
MDPSEYTPKVKLLECLQFYELTGKWPTNMPAATFEPIKYPIGPGFIKYIREPFGSLSLQIFEVPLACLPFPLTGWPDAGDDFNCISGCRMEAIQMLHQS